MTMNKQHFLLLALGATALLGLSGCQKGGGGTVAKIDGETVSAEEYVEYLKTKPTVRVNVDGQVVELPVANSLGFQAMQDLVGKRAVIVLAKESKVAPTDADVEKEIKFRNELTPGYLQKLKDEGLSMAQIRREVMYSLSQERLLTKGITIPMKEVEDFIKTNPNQFVEPASVVMDIVYVPDAASRDKAEADFKKGNAFDVVKQRHDKAPPALRSAFDSSVQSSKGVPIESLQPAFKDAVNATEAGSITKWVPAESGFAKFKVIKKNPKKDIKITAERKEFLQRQMMIQRGQQTNDLQDKIEKKMREANIEVTEESVKEQWKKFMDQLKKQNPAATAPGTPPAQ